jgi:hypothetical protein
MGRQTTRIVSSSSSSSTMGEGGKLYEDPCKHTEYTEYTYRTYKNYGYTIYCR